MPKKAPPRTPSATILAAGAVLWRTADAADPTPSRSRVVHRPRYDDWSLPKGKVDPGETEPVTAVREIEEETGYACELGRRLAVGQLSRRAGHQEGALLGGPRARRRVHARIDEVDELLWLPVEDAMKRLQYPHDRKVLRRFAKHPADTRTVLIVRHGTAGTQVAVQGRRPQAAARQARSRAGRVAGGPAAGVRRHRPVRRPSVRCHQTLEPLAEELGVTIRDEPTLTEEAYADDRRAGRHRVLEIAKSDGTPVICTQGKVIPDLIAWWCDRDGVRPDKSRNRKGSTWVLSLARRQLVAADHIGSPLAVRRLVDTRRHAVDPKIHGASCTGTDSGTSCLLAALLAGAFLAGGLLDGGLLGPEPSWRRPS